MLLNHDMDLAFVKVLDNLTRIANRTIGAGLGGMIQIQWAIFRLAGIVLMLLLRYTSLLNEWDHSGRSICHTATPPSVLFVSLSQVKSADLKKLRANTKKTPLHVVLSSIGERMRNFVAKSGLHP